VKLVKKETIMRHVRTLCAIALTTLSVLSVPVNAQKPVTQGAEVSKTFSIEAIDYSARLVTLKGPSGETETILCGPEVQRFDALKVGDTVTFRYYESVVYAIRKPGSAPAAGGASVTRVPGDRPGATIAQQMIAVVTVNTIDMKVPSVTITTKDGRKMSFKVQDRKNLEGVKVGDQVEVTYTQALAVSVAPGK
jgi:Cu/Ag efflux protein CusF